MFSRKLAVAGVGLAVLTTTSPSAASAQDSADWNCRASVARVDLGDQQRIEPLVANGSSDRSAPDRPRCADDDARTGSIAGPPLTQVNPFAATSRDPDTGPVAAQQVRAETGADSTTFATPDGQLSVSAAAIRAQASARCVGDVPVLVSSSSVADVTVNGQPVGDLNAGFEQVGTGLNGSPIGGVIRIVFNEETRDASRVTRRAVHLTVTAPDGTTLVDAVAGEASVSHSGAVCAPPPGTPPSVCPPNTSFDTTSGLCVLIVTVPGQPGPRSEGAGGDGGGDGGSGQGGSGQGVNCPEGFTYAGGSTCIRAVPVDDAGNPLGGSVVPLDMVPEAAKSICRGKRFGKQLVAIRGTSRGDRITGTNKSDRMFVLGGNDFASGGRGNDCLEGGTGRNRLDGSTGSDYLLGGSAKDALVGSSGSDKLFGRAGSDRMTGGLGSDYLSGSSGSDKLSGGAGNDRIFGGAGKDFIDLGTGRDSVKAGAGNDSVNASRAGPAARIDCGPGRDTARVNANEARRARSCERLFVLRRSR